MELNGTPCENRFMIQVGLLREDNNFPWAAIIDWLKKIFPLYQTADFRSLIERGITTTLSLGTAAMLTFLESAVNFSFVGPICDSIGVQRQDLLEMRNFSEQAQSIEITNGLILELTNFVMRERLSAIVIISWLKIFNPQFSDSGNLKKTFKLLRTKIKRLRMCCRQFDTRSHRRSADLESLLQTPFELLPKKAPRMIRKNETNPQKKRKRDEATDEKVSSREECEAAERPETVCEGAKKVPQKERVHEQSRADLNCASKKTGESSPQKEEAATLLDIAMLSVHKLSHVYNRKNSTINQLSMNLLKNQYALTCKEHPAMVEFEEKFDSLGENVSLASPMSFLNYNAHFLVGVHNAVEQHIMNFESEIILSAGEKLGRDKLPKFKNFLSLKESATSRYIHMACEILSSSSPDKKTYRRHWVAFCKEMKNPSRLVYNQAERLSCYFEAAAGLTHHHQEIVPFISDLLSLDTEEFPDIVLESLAADADDSVIQSLVCVLAIVHCKILGPYWQLLRSGAEYSLFSKYILCLYQKFLDWSKDPSSLLEPEGSTNIFQQFPMQEKVFNEVFCYCSKWHTNRELIRACLKRTIKVIAGVTEEHMKDFLPGGIFGQVPSADVSLHLVSCTFSVLMADYPFSDAFPYKKRNSEKSSKVSSDDSSQEEGRLSGTSDVSSDECSHQSIKAKRKGQVAKKVARPPEERVENMDQDYIAAVVSSNGGPCKSQQDVDKMMLRFDGMSRKEKREAMRCELLYHKMVLNNSSPHLNGPYQVTTQMVIKLKLALPRVKPGYSLVLEPRRPRKCPKLLEPSDASTAQSESSST